MLINGQINDAILQLNEWINIDSNMQGYTIVVTTDESDIMDQLAMSSKTIQVKDLLDGNILVIWN
jgi:hypothetical protein